MIGINTQEFEQLPLHIPGLFLTFLHFLSGSFFRFTLCFDIVRRLI